MKKIKQNHIDINPRFGKTVVIDNYIFCHDEDVSTLIVLYTDFCEDVEVIEIIDTNEDDTVIISDEDLRIYALNWIFDNVEIVKEV